MDRPQERTALRPLLAAGILCLTVLGAASARAQALIGTPGGNMNATLVGGGVQGTTGAGLIMTFDNRWLSGCGYRPLRITITPTAPPPADRTLSLDVVTRSFHGRRPRERHVLADVEIPAGSGPVSLVLAVPELAGWNDMAIKVAEDGKVLKTLSVRMPNRSYYLGTPDGLQQLPRVLFLGENTPDTNDLGKRFAVQEAALQMARMTNSVVQVNEQLPSLMTLKAAECPVRWIDYSSLDVVCTSVEQLSALERTRPAALEAILRWTAAGGNLWVYGVGKDWGRLAEAERMLGLPKPDEGDPLARGWREPDKKLYGRPSEFEKASAEFMGGMTGGPGLMLGQNMEVAITEEAAAQPEPKPRPKPPDRPHFLLRNCQFGRIVALAPEDPFPGTEYDWGWVVDAIGSGRLNWPARHGVSMVGPNMGFWNFLISGVGLPPVGTFRVLITLFVVAIGPVNYFLLRRWKRLHLLVITVPASAAVVTVVLVGYALVGDGLATRVRVRSFTQIDQRLGQAVCWARLSYYAGIAPAEGLRFSGDTAVLPLMAGHVGARETSVRELTWDDDQRLQRGWLRSRMPTQFVTVRCRPSQHKLQITSPKDDTGPMSVRNHLGTTIEHLVVQDKDGKHYAAKTAIDAGATAQLQQIDSAGAMQPLRQIELDRRPQIPPSMDRWAGGPRRRRAFGRRGAYRFSGDEMMSIQGASILERELKKLAIATDPSDPHSPLLVPGSYVAVVRSSPEVSLGVDSAREEDSFHVIRGKW